MDLNYERIFKPTLRALRMTRSDPYIKKDKKWFIQFMLLHVPYTLYCLVFIHNIIFINSKAKDFTLICKNGTIAVVYLVISFFNCVLLWKSKHVISLMDNIKRDFELAEELPVEEQKIILHYAKKGGIVSKQWMWLTLVGACLYFINNFFVHLFYWHTSGEFRLVPIFDLVYPDFIQSRNEYFLVYFVFYWFNVVIITTYSALIYTGFVPLGPIFMLHASGQLVIVKKRITILFDGDDITEIEQRLKDIITRLQYIYEFIEQIQISFRVVYEITLKGSTLILPIIGFDIIESLKNGVVTVESFSIFVGGVLISAAPCYYSNLLMDKGEDIRLAIYSCGWEKVYHRGARSTILIVLLRAIRSSGIRTLFREVCLVTLSEVFQQAYTIFNLMNCMWN